MKPWHQSWLEDMLICPERYRRNHETDEQGGTSAAALMGTAVHEAVAHNLRNLRDLGLYEDPLVIAEEAQFGFHLLAEADKDSEDPIPWGEGSQAERSIEVRIMTAALWQGMEGILKQHGAPLLIEQEFKDVPFPLPDNTWGIANVNLEGTWDLLTSGHVLIDWKTSSRGWPPGRENSKLQPLVYALGVEHVTGKWPNAFIYYVVDRKGKIQTRPVSLDKKRLAFLEATLPELERMRREGIYPLNPSSPLCSEAYCPWFLRGCPARELKAA